MSYKLIVNDDTTIYWNTFFSSKLTNKTEWYETSNSLRIVSKNEGTRYITKEHPYDCYFANMLKGEYGIDTIPDVAEMITRLMKPTNETYIHSNIENNTKHLSQDRIQNSLTKLDKELKTIIDDSIKINWNLHSDDENSEFAKAIVDEAKKYLNDYKEDIKKDIFAEAQELISGSRHNDYGTAKDNFTDIGRIWGTLLGIPDIKPEMVGLMMAGLKIAREKYKHKKDNIIDGIGYLKLSNDIIEGN